MLLASMDMNEENFITALLTFYPSYLALSEFPVYQSP